MKNKSRDWMLIILFCGSLLVFSILYLVLPQKEFSENEKRVLRTFPSVDMGAILDGKFEDDTETAFSDQVPFRDAFVGAYAYTKLALGQNGLSGVILGNDGSLYAAAEKYDEEAVASKLNRINRFAEESGIKTDLMLIPTSGYMFEEKLPAPHDPYHDAELKELASQTLSDKVTLLWPEESLKADGMYYHTDHHLTSFGSYTACGAYMKSIGRDMPEAELYEKEINENFHGSMYSKSGLWFTPAETIELWKLKDQGTVAVTIENDAVYDDMFFRDHLNTSDKYCVFLDGNHGIVKIETGNTGGGTLLMIRDSFGHCFAPFAAASFEKIVLVDLRYYRGSLKELAEEEKVDHTLFLYGVDSFLTDSNFGWLKYE